MLAKDILSYSIVLTNACNMGCRHCYLGDHRYIPMTLSISKVKSLVERIMQVSKRPSFDWGGGEPLLLGKKYFRELVELPCFSGGFENTLYSTYQVEFDNEWKEILSRFTGIIFSLDSYRFELKNWSLKKALSVISNLDVVKEISYTPSSQDTKRKLEEFYKIAHDMGADVFHIGFLYSDTELIPANVYIKILDWAKELEQKYVRPELGYKDKGENIYHRIGWRAYDCFTKCIYICEGIVTSCYILYSRGYPVPYIKLDDFIDGKEDITEMNKNFIEKFFFRDRIEVCSDCSYYSLCMGGCPYFTWRNESNTKNKKDMYCDVYKKIFEIMGVKDE